MKTKFLFVIGLALFASIVVWKSNKTISAIFESNVEALTNRDGGEWVALNTELKGYVKVENEFFSTYGYSGMGNTHGANYGPGDNECKGSYIRGQIIGDCTVVGQWIYIPDLNPFICEQDNTYVKPPFIPYP